MAIGKTAFSYLDEGIALYEKRLKRYCKYDREILSDIKNAKNLSKDLLKGKEGEAVLKKIQKSDFLILLDDKGKEFTSLKFANYLEQKLLPSGRNVVFLVGGAYGFSKEVYERSDAKLSLSKMTFSHQMVRLFFLEQLYRAFTILKNEPYHHE